MADIRECPVCGEDMRLQIGETSDHVPGTAQTTTRILREWVCPECEYWEEAETREEG